MKWSDTRAALEWVIEGIVQKSEGQAKILTWLANRVPSQKQALNDVNDKMNGLLKDLRALTIRETDPTPEEIRAVEGQLGRNYWEAYFGALKKYETATKRSRQPAEDPLNALLNYGYGMLYGEVESAVLTAGLDPQVGVLHREEYNRPVFVYDAIEPYRPWVDRMVAELAIGGEIKQAWFSSGKKGVWLTGPGKKVFIPAWYNVMLSTTRFQGKQIKRKDQIQAAMTQLAQGFLKEEEV